MKVECKSCGYTWDTKTNNPRCPKCGSSKIAAVLPEDDENDTPTNEMGNSESEREDAMESSNLESSGDLKDIEMDTSLLDNKDLDMDILEGNNEVEKTDAEKRIEEKGTLAEFQGLLSQFIPMLIEMVFQRIHEKDEKFAPLSSIEKNQLTDAIKLIEYESPINVTVKGGWGALIGAIAMMTMMRIPWIMDKMTHIGKPKVVVK